jgi:hypothetical protein
LWVVSCGQFGFHGEAAHLPRKRGCSVEETRHWLYHTGTTQCCSYSYGLDDPPPDRESQTPTEELDTAPVTAVGFASKNVEIRTELENRVLYAM